jgi:phospholipase/carboxylesterase
MVSAQHLHLGGLDVIEVPGEPGGPVIVLLHGYGADQNDLAPLCQYIEAPAATNWLFPNAPIEVALGPSMSGRSWFPIDTQAIQEAAMRGGHRDMSRAAPPEFADARDLVANMLEAYDVPLSRVLIGGFSQGAMIATEVALTAAVAPAGLAILSGTLIDRERWAEQAARRTGLRFFQSHGRVDPLLSFEAAQELHTLLSDAGLVGQWQPFDGQHEIPARVLHELGTYIESLSWAG